MATLTQPNEGVGAAAEPRQRKLQIWVEEDVYLRLRHISAKTRVATGKIVSDTLKAALPALGEVA